MVPYRDPWPIAPDDDRDDAADDDIDADDTDADDTDGDGPDGDGPAARADELDDPVRIDGDEDDDPLLDEAFPLGDGVADDSAVVYCPYCGEPNEIALDPGSGSQQAYVEDCQVCCQPWQVVVHYLPDGSAAVTVLAADET